ncbi:MAG: isocitrate/isopropylmalate family dehydrogenase, partial [Candidatus Hodarchaeales archaeon]
MSRYKISVLPGDGIGSDVIKATINVLDTVGFSNQVEYLYGDIGWEFWCKEGNALPDRTIELLKESNCSLFGAITSKPKEEADAELDPSLKNK